MCLINQRKDRVPFALGHLRTPAQPLCGASDRCLPPQIHRLGMDGIAEITLQGRPLLCCS